MRLSEWLPTWLETWCAQLRPTTLESYQDITSRYLVPALGEIPLEDLTPEHIQGLLNTQLLVGHERTAQLTYTILSTALKRAVRSRHVGFNPCEWLDKPSHRTADVHALTLEEEGRFRSAGPPDTYWAAIALALLAGLRRGEVIALQWRDVDLKGRVLHVRRNAVLVENKLVVGPPKSRAGFRTVPLCDTLADALSAQRVACLGKGRASPARPVVPGRSGGLLTPSTFRTHNKQVAAMAAVQDVTIHGLRHTFATRCLQRGLSLKSLQYILGHSSMTLTADLYAHCQLDHIVSEFNDICAQM